MTLGAVILLLFQVAAGQLSGDVSDPSGKAIAGATVRITEMESNAEMTANSTSAGNYVVFPVKPGLYRVFVEAPGFQRLVREGVRMTTGERVRLDLQLEVGAVTQSITVS